MRYLIKFSYDGTNFFGYQKQPNLRTIEGEFEKALYSVNNHKETRIFSSGRTDAGVHALAQTAHFDLNINITLYKLKCALNSLLPKDIHVISTETVDKDFHARYSAKGKTYEYKINIGEYSPIYRNSVYQYNKMLNIDKMKEGIQYLIGKHDFKAFVSDECIKSNYVRTIKEADISIVDNIITITFTGDGFMKYQVRNMVGILIKIGEEKFDASIIKEIFENYELRKFIVTAKSEGLRLKSVEY